MKLKEIKELLSKNKILYYWYKDGYDTKIKIIFKESDIGMDYIDKIKIF